MRLVARNSSSSSDNATNTKNDKDNDDDESAGLDLLAALLACQSDFAERDTVRLLVSLRLRYSIRVHS